MVIVHVGTLSLQVGRKESSPGVCRGGDSPDQRAGAADCGAMYRGGIGGGSDGAVGAAVVRAEGATGALAGTGSLQSMRFSRPTGLSPGWSLHSLSGYELGAGADQCAPTGVCLRWEGWPRQPGGVAPAPC